MTQSHVDKFIYTESLSVCVGLFNDVLITAYDVKCRNDRRMIYCWSCIAQGVGQGSHTCCEVDFETETLGIRMREHGVADTKQMMKSGI